MRREKTTEIEQFSGVKGPSKFPISKFYNPRIRKKEFSHLGCRSILRIAYNLAEAFHILHQKNFVMANIKDSNIMVSEDANVELIIIDNSKRRGKASVKYTPPGCLENTSGCNEKTKLYYDLFGLGVLLFLLLMEGTYPFDYRRSKIGFAKRIKSGHFPYGLSSDEYQPKRNAPPFDKLFPELQELFRQCFEDGYKSPGKRPKASEWKAALINIMDQQCKGKCCYDQNSNHTKLNLNVSCPWCSIAAKIVYTLDQNSPQKTSQLARSIKEKYDKTRRVCITLEDQGIITSKLRPITLYFLPVIDMVVDADIYDFILKLKSKIHQYMGNPAELDVFIAMLFKRSPFKDKKWLKKKIEKIIKLIKAALANNGIKAALKVLAIFPFKGKARYWRLNKSMTKPKIRSFILRKLALNEF